ncbi:MAG TPA: alpha-amylase family glycosyl hydrolase [Candidatus Eisenbacteria bacterium]|nr:alpha-amylase family glycosyl hydrolase [Candidatus Eisenbacteria bacterium]
MSAPWWKTAVVYQIYPRSFLDTGGDGVGDLEGIRRRLEHLVWLGVDAVWLSPVFRSPMKDFGYDVADYCDVDPLFGTLADLDRLVAEAHAKGLRVLLDWVPNHTSDQHPWFVESRRSRTSPKRGWYFWRDPAPNGAPPNNWTAAFPLGTPAWTLDRGTGQYYLHQFLPEQPDLDWSNPEVVAAMHDVVRFWLGRGIDGFRVDVVHGIGKDPALPDEPRERAGIPHVAVNEHSSTHAHLRALRKLVDSYPGDRMLVGEVFQLFTHALPAYFGANDELHLAFDLPASVVTPWEAAEWEARIRAVAAELDPLGAWPTWVLSNHDVPRHRSRFGSEARARAAAVMLLTLRGTPFLYAGEELGLEDADVPRERQVDPGGRDGCRAPIPWDASPTHGWATPDPWLPWPPEPSTRNLEHQREDPGSILYLYRRLLHARKGSPALRTGDLTLRSTPPGVLAYDRHTADERWTILVNFTNESVAYPASGTIHVATNVESEGEPYQGLLKADQGLLLARKK